jgi:hypothetical protein
MYSSGPRPGRRRSSCVRVPAGRLARGSPPRLEIDRADGLALGVEAHQVQVLVLVEPSGLQAIE